MLKFKLQNSMKNNKKYDVTTNNVYNIYKIIFILFYYPNAKVKIIKSIKTYCV